MLAGVVRNRTVMAVATLATLLMICAANVTFGQGLVSAGRGRVLAPDTLEIIKPAAEPGETAFGPIDLPLVANHPELAWKPNYDSESDTLVGMSKQVVFRGDVHCLEFAFKPVRMIEVNGKLVWYLLYRVRYLGGDLRPDRSKDNYGNEIYANPQAVSAEWVRFFPSFVLNSLSVKKEYLDRVNPEAKALIAAKERVGKPVFDTLEMQRQRITRSTEAVNNEYWGVATWDGVDADTDFFSVRVRGLTNAQKLETRGEKIGYLQKMLVLHFSRPGDAVNEIEDTIRYGIPAIEDPARQKYVLDQYGMTERLDHIWVYR